MWKVLKEWLLKKQEKRKQNFVNDVKKLVRQKGAVQVTFLQR